MPDDFLQARRDDTKIRVRKRKAADDHVINFVRSVYGPWGNNYVYVKK